MDICLLLFQVSTKSKKKKERERKKSANICIFQKIFSKLPMQKAFDLHQERYLL